MEKWDESRRGFIREEAPLINGVKAAEEHGRGLFSHVYDELNVAVDFTGGLLATGDFIQDLYVHMGFHPAWKYKTVFEVIFSHGNVIETRNVSDRMEEIRKKMVKSPLQPGVNATKEEVQEWVASTFKLNYNL